MNATMTLNVGWEEKLAEKLRGTSMWRSLKSRVKELTKMVMTGQAVEREAEDVTDNG